MADINHVFGGSPPAWDSPAPNAEAVTPDDNADLPTKARALWVGTGGDVTGVTWAGNTVTVKNVDDGRIVPIAFVRILESTTATDILALW